MPLLLLVPFVAVIVVVVVEPVVVDLAGGKVRAGTMIVGIKMPR